MFALISPFTVSGGGFIFAFRVLPTLIFFSALISVLYYIGVMQWVIKILGGALQKALGTSRAESMSAAANIFVGQTEAPLVVRPFVPKMTQSELFAVMCGGLASVAGGVLAGYASMGVPLEYLVAASFMAAPGGLLFAKILHPETDQPHESIEEAMDGGDDKPVNVIDAAAGGAASGLQLALNVGAMLIAFVGLIALINGMLGGIGGWFGMPVAELEIPMIGIDAALVLCYRDEYRQVLKEKRGEFTVYTAHEWLVDALNEWPAVRASDEEPWYLMAHCTEKTNTQKQLDKEQALAAQAKALSHPARLRILLGLDC